MKTILILYEKNGAGHRRAAKIIESMLADRADCRVISVAGSELFNDPGVEIINWLWIYLVRKNWLTLADWLMNFHLRAWILPILEASQLAGYHDKLDELMPDAVICTADGFGKLLGLYAQERSIPLYMVSVEFSMFADLVNPLATHICYFPETMNAIRSYRFEDTYFSRQLDRSSSFGDKIKYVLSVYRDHIRAGGARSIYRNIDRPHLEHNRARCIAVGPLVEPAYFAPKNQRELRKKLGVSPDKLCVVTLSGSIGGDYLHEVVTAFADGWEKPLTLIALCGRDLASLRKLEASKRRNPAIELRPLGFVGNIDEFYAVADVVIARPSASVIVEVMMQHVPILIPEWTSANDLGGVELVKKHRLGEVYRNRNDIVASFQRLIEHHAHYVDAICRFLAPYPAEYSVLQETLVELILGREAQRFSEREGTDPALSYEVRGMPETIGTRAINADAEVAGGALGPRG